MMDVACGWHGFWPDCSELPAIPNYLPLPYIVVSTSVERGTDIFIGSVVP